jgi:hypothetical protein
MNDIAYLAVFIYSPLLLRSVQAACDFIARGPSVKFLVPSYTLRVAGWRALWAWVERDSESAGVYPPIALSEHNDEIRWSTYEHELSSQYGWVSISVGSEHMHSCRADSLMSLLLLLPLTLLCPQHVLRLEGFFVHFHPRPAGLGEPY